MSTKKRIAPPGGLTLAPAQADRTPPTGPPPALGGSFVLQADGSWLREEYTPAPDDPNHVNNRQPPADGKPEGDAR